MALEKDINAVFDDILFSEEHILKEAFLEGVDKGAQDGELDGYHAGYHRGLEIGTEIGYYRGIVKLLLENENDVAQKYDKISKNLGKLTELLKNFPGNNSPDVDIYGQLDCIRAQYRKISSVLKLHTFNPTESKISF